MRAAELLRAALGLAAPAAVILVGVLLHVWEPAPVQAVRNAGFDQFQRWQPRAYRDVPVRIVDIDDESLRRFGQWPWPRTLIAELVTRLQDAGAAAIAFDVVFAEPDRSSPRAALEQWRLSPAQRAELETLPDHDQILSEAIARGQVVLGFAFDAQRESATPPPTRARFVISGEPPHLPAFSGAVTALPLLGEAAAGNGSIAFVPDADGVVRKVPLVFRLGAKLVPSFSAEALRVAQGDTNYTVRTTPALRPGVAEVRIGALTIPTTPAGEVWIRYTGPQAARYIPAWKILSGETTADELAGRILLVGTSAQGLMDLRFSPMGGIMPGVEAHAQLLEQVLAGDGLNRPAWMGAAEIVVIVIGGLIVGITALRAGAMVSLGAFVALLVVLWAGAWHAFVARGLLADAALPSLVLGAAFMVGSALHHLASERRQRWVRAAFSRYVSPNLVAHLIDHPEALELGGRRQQCSFVFTDLAGFTAMVERMAPATAVSLLNDYLDRMIAIAFAHEGTLDRIVGDALAIMFSAPVPQADHQRRALACAMEMQRFAAAYAATLKARGIEFGHTRIGIHSGEVIVGNFGGRTMFDYRALGDAVNTASRLEGANRYLGTLTCVSAATLAGCPDWPARPIGRVLLKGKREPIEVFEPLDVGPPPATDSAYADAFALLRAGNAGARAAFEALAAERIDDALVKLHVERLRQGAHDDLIVLAGK